MNEAMVKFMAQRGKNLTLLILCGTAVAIWHKDVAGIVMTAVCAAVSAPAIAEKWPSASTGETK